MCPKKISKFEIRNPKKNSGFSIFELVVFIISVAIIYAYAANRFADFPSQAERANFIAVLTQLQSGVNLELMFSMKGGRLQDPEIFEGINPMDLMLSPPSNYLGSLREVDESSLDRRTWYFDEVNSQLVYLVNDNEGVTLEINGLQIPAESLRFKVEPQYREFDSVRNVDASIARRLGSNENIAVSEQFSGVLIRPIVEFTWGTPDASTLLTPALESITQ